MNGDFNNGSNNDNNLNSLNSLNGGLNNNTEVNNTNFQTNNTQPDMGVFNQQNEIINLTSNPVNNTELPMNETVNPMESEMVTPTTPQVTVNQEIPIPTGTVISNPEVNQVNDFAMPTLNGNNETPVNTATDMTTNMATNTTQPTPEPVNPTIQSDVSLGNVSTMQVVNPDGTTPNPTQNTQKNNKAKINPAIIIVGVIILLVVLGYFVIFPFVQKTFMSNPKNVFETTIKNAAKEVNGVIDDVPLESALVDLTLKLDTNISELQDFSGYTYGVKAGVKPSEKLMEAGFYITDKSKTEYSANMYLKDNKTYVKFHNYNDLIYAGEENQEEMDETFKELEELFTSQSEISNDDINYLVDKFTTLLIETLDEEKLSKEDATLKVNGKEIKATKNTYAVDKTVYKNTFTHIIDGLKNDEKALKILASFAEITVDEMKTQMSEELNFDDIEDDFLIKINIYTAGRKNDVVGYDMEQNGKTPISYYYNDGDFELLIDESATADSETTTDELTEIANKIKINGVKDGDKTDVEIIYNDKKIATLEVSQWDEKGVKFSYVIEVEEDKITGNVNYSLTESSNKNDMKLDVSAKSGTDEISVSLGLLLDYTSKISDIDTSKAVTLTEDQLTQVSTNWMNSISSLPPVKALVGTMSGLMDQGTLEDSYDYDYDYDYDDDYSYDYGM